MDKNFKIENQSKNTPHEYGVIKQEEEIGAEKKWNEMRSTVDQITDALGLEIDEGIKDTVTALRVFHINTVSSHEGKMERWPAPYVDIEAPEAFDLEKKLDSLASEQEVEFESLAKEIIRKNLEERKKLIPLLEEFYIDRNVTYETRLYIRPFARGWTRLENQGAEFQDIEDDEVIKKQRLQEFQDEMNAFAEFLKKKFLNK